MDVNGLTIRKPLTRVYNLFEDLLIVFFDLLSLLNILFLTFTYTSDSVLSSYYYYTSLLLLLFSYSTPSLFSASYSLTAILVFYLLIVAEYIFLFFMSNLLPDTPIAD